MPLRLLHVSDIHFHHTGWDEDLDQRRELVRDVEQLVAATGPMNAILVGGDIAYSAEPAQYEKADAWITELREVGGGLEPGDVWMVPGNHDINRATVRASTTAKEFREALKNCRADDVDFILHDRMSQDPARDGLMLPLDEYNSFAERFACGTTAESPSWFDDALSVGTLRVRLTGINSVLASYEDHSNAEDRNLVVGVHQCHLERRKGLVHIAMLHHPPHWLKDWDIVEPYLRRAHLLLFGHEHAFAARQAIPGGTVEVSAGAVAPERQRGGEQEPYVACYNVITIDQDSEDSISVEVLPRYWSKSSTRYEDHPGGAQTFRVDLDPALDLPNRGQTVRTDSEETQEVASSDASPLAEDVADASESVTQAAAERLNLRRIGVRFLNLPVTRRRQVARQLKVLDDDDLALPATELWPTVLTRVRDRGLVSELAEELSR